jgi:hypothetical protein
LIEEFDANLMFDEARAGRLCEVAVVLAAGSHGLPESQVVKERRAYADHLGIRLCGRTCDSDQPGHIEHALTHSNHNPRASNRINLGRAKATKSAGRYDIA